MAFPVINGTEVLLPPPEGWVVNFTHPYRDESTKTNVFLAFGTEFPIATLFLAQRIYTSLFVMGKFLVDDYLIVAAWVIHALTLTAILGTVLAKLVLCIFYYRLSPARRYRYGILFTGFLCIACFGSVWLAVMFACRPVAAAWDLRLYTGDNCISRPPWYLLQAIAGGVTDFLLMLHPIPTVLGLQMSAKRKAALLAWFGIGTITLCRRRHAPDTPWTMADAMLWLVVESNLIVLCGCLPPSASSSSTSHPSSVAPTKLKARAGARDTGVGGGGGSSSDRGSHKLRTFGAGSTRKEFDSIAEIGLGDHFRPANYHHRQTTSSAPGSGTAVGEIGNDTACSAGHDGGGDGASHAEHGSEANALRHMQDEGDARLTREVTSAW
ncbi:uncharacterized protein PG986_001270 [Apiospora aurea]|uniref:Rhodopsin domain-containing protein n=1 Tax=Apiospora aurea TaxID=335848 RepID=A0ABR1QX43_9PEZI